MRSSLLPLQPLAVFTFNTMMLPNLVLINSLDLSSALPSVVRYKQTLCICIIRQARYVEVFDKVIVIFKNT